MASGNGSHSDSSVVLYIDDDATNRQLMERVFSRRRPGDRLLVAATGAEGLEESRRSQVDLVLLDLSLPDMSGEEVLCSLKAEQAVPVAILSGHADQQTSQRLSDSGADAYVTKPFDVADLCEVIDRLLSQS